MTVRGKISHPGTLWGLGRVFLSLLFLLISVIRESPQKAWPTCPVQPTGEAPGQRLSYFWEVAWWDLWAAGADY